ncbi:MAG: hypothetical protein WD851_03525 [Pirellulales bacterium]
MNRFSRSTYFKLCAGCRVLVSGCLFAAAGSLSAQTIWNAGTGNWNTAANWTLGVPNSASGTTFDAQIKNGGTAQLSAPGASVRRMRVGVNAGGGNLEVNGGGLTVTEDFILNFEGLGVATTTVQSGGIVTVPATVVGYSVAGTSIFLITGGGSRVNATTSFVVGRGATGTLTLANGGTLAVGNGTLPLEIATLAGSTGYVNIGNGGTAGVLQASAVQFGAGFGQLRLNHTSNLTFATPISGPGGVYEIGPGTTTLSGTNSYTSQTNVGGGTLAISADANLGTPPLSFNSQQLVLDGGTLRATQSFTLAATRGITLGSGGGTIEVDATKTLTYPNNLYLTAGTMTKSGAGALSLQLLVIGASGGSSALLITGGGTLATSDDSYLTVGVGASTGTATVRGAGSTWNVGADLIFGNGALGTLNIEDRALVHVAGAAIFNQGTVNLSGDTLRFNGYDPAGTFNFNSGTIQLAGNRTVGADAAIVDLFGPEPAISTGKGLTIEGTATLTKAVTLDGGTFTVGGLVNGSNLHLNRGTLNVTNQALTIGAGGLFGGTLDLAHDVAVNVTLGVTNQGLVTGDGRIGGRLQNAATGELRAEPGRSLTLTGANNTNSGQVSLFGGQLEFTQNLTNNAAGFISGNGTLIARTGLVNTGTMNFSGAANVVGDVTNSATGKIISAGGGPTTFFDDVTNQGQIRTSAGAFTVFFGSVSGAGTFTGPGTVNFEGDLKPGNSAAAVQFAGDVAFGSDAALQLELGGVAAASQYDRLNVTGELALGGALELSLINGFNPSLGDSFDILDWGTLSGTFDTLQLPTLAGLAWNTSQLYTTGELSLAAAGLLGDYNQNGVVDAADYTVWRDTLGDTLNYNLWKANFGAVSPGIGADAGSFPSSAVPEPATLVLLVLTAAAWCLRLNRFLPT